MRGLRQRAGALLMVALLVVPVVARAHVHRDLQAASSCATCIATHHSPAVVLPPLGATAPATPAIAAAPPPCLVPVFPHRSPRAGRAPPPPAPISVA